jgi:hypothetical protein
MIDSPETDGAFGVHAQPTALARRVVRTVENKLTIQVNADDLNCQVTQVRPARVVFIRVRLPRAALKEELDGIRAEHNTTSQLLTRQSLESSSD